MKMMQISTQNWSKIWFNLEPKMTSYLLHTGGRASFLSDDDESDILLSVF